MLYRLLFRFFTFMLNLFNPLYNFSQKQEKDESEIATGGGRLLEGTYDEQASAASFQEALREWRNPPSSLPAQKNGLWVNPVVDLKTGIL